MTREEYKIQCVLVEDRIDSEYKWAKTGISSHPSDYYEVENRDFDITWLSFTELKEVIKEVEFYTKMVDVYGEPEVDGECSEYSNEMVIRVRTLVLVDQATVDALKRELCYKIIEEAISVALLGNYYLNKNILSLYIDGDITFEKMCEITKERL